MREARTGDPELDVAWLPEGAERRRRFEAWVRDSDELFPLVEAWRAARSEAARSAGAPSTWEFLAAGQARDPRDVALEFERGAIAPLDHAIECAQRPDLAPWDVPALGALARHGRTPKRTAIVRTLSDLSAGFGPAAGQVARVEAPTPGPRRTRVAVAAGGAAQVVVGTSEGPAAWVEALAALGEVLRAGFLARTRGPAAARFSDSAFVHAARTLFRRLALDPEGILASGSPVSPERIADLRLHEAVAVREGWAYLELTLRNTAPGAESADAILRRASGRPRTPAARRRAAATDPEGAAELRGVVFGLLLEERLRTRYGRAWPASRGARSLLCEIWEAEPDETVETLTAALGWGSIEPTPIADCCRP